MWNEVRPFFQHVRSESSFPRVLITALYQRSYLLRPKSVLSYPSSIYTLHATFNLNHSLHGITEWLCKIQVSVLPQCSFSVPRPHDRRYQDLIPERSGYLWKNSPLGRLGKGEADKPSDIDKWLSPRCRLAQDSRQGSWSMARSVRPTSEKVRIRDRDPFPGSWVNYFRFY